MTTNQDKKIEPFYCRPATYEEAVDICERAVANGAEKYEWPSNEDVGQSKHQPWEYFGCWGVNKDKRTYTSFETDAVTLFGEDADLLSIHQVRERYPFPDEVKEDQTIYVTENKQEFVPEVGQECEYKELGYISWWRGILVAITRNSYVFEKPDGTDRCMKKDIVEGFRAIKTEAEIRREKAIESLTADICNMSDMYLVPPGLLAERLAKEGYIKPRELKREDIERYIDQTEMGGSVNEYLHNLCRWAEKHIKGEA